jgi:hypothetical protein
MNSCDQPGQTLIALGHCHMVGRRRSNRAQHRRGGSEDLQASTIARQHAWRSASLRHLRFCGVLLFSATSCLPAPVRGPAGRRSQCAPALNARAVDLLRIRPGLTCWPPSNPGPAAADRPNALRPEVRVRLDARPGQCAALVKLLRGAASKMVALRHRRANGLACRTLNSCSNANLIPASQQEYNAKHRAASVLLRRPLAGRARSNMELRPRFLGGWSGGFWRVHSSPPACSPSAAPHRRGKAPAGRW